MQAIDDMYRVSITFAGSDTKVEGFRIEGASEELVSLTEICKFLGKPRNSVLLIAKGKTQYAPRMSEFLGCETEHPNNKKVKLYPIGLLELFVHYWADRGNEKAQRVRMFQFRRSMTFVGEKKKVERRTTSYRAKACRDAIKDLRQELKDEKKAFAEDRKVELEDALSDYRNGYLTKAEYAEKVKAINEDYEHEFSVREKLCEEQCAQLEKLAVKYAALGWDGDIEWEKLVALPNVTAQVKLKDFPDHLLAQRMIGQLTALNTGGTTARRSPN